METNSSGNETRLILLYKLGEGSGTVLKDSGAQPSGWDHLRCELGHLVLHATRLNQSTDPQDVADVQGPWCRPLRTGVRRLVARIYATWHIYATAALCQTLF